MIIRDVSLTLQVKDVEQALAGVRGIVVSAGGVVTKSSTSLKGDDMIATLTVQVPTRSFDPVIQSLRQLAVKVESEVGASQDVTDEFVDLDSQVRNLQATEAQLLRVMERATTITDILAVQRELTNVRGQIEKAQGRMNFLKQRSDMATINISMRTPPAVEKKPPTSWDPGETARTTWEQSMGFWRAVIDLAIVVSVFFWWLVPIGAIAGLVVVMEQRRRGKPSS